MSQLKPLWEAAKKINQDFAARGFLKRAIATYRAGFEADWRDPYPGVNAVTLMEMEDKPGQAQQQMLPVVRYAAEQRVRKAGDDGAQSEVHALDAPIARRGRGVDRRDRAGSGTNRRASDGTGGPAGMRQIPSRRFAARRRSCRQSALFGADTSARGRAAS